MTTAGVEPIGWEKHCFEMKIHNLKIPLLLAEL
jgi:hypothetical protein